MWKPPFNTKQIDLQKLTTQGLKYAKMPVVWLIVVGIIAYVALHAAEWGRKSDLLNIIHSGGAGMICLSHEASIFERGGMSKSYATTKTYIRFDRETFIRDYLKRDAKSMAFLAVAVDFNNQVYWSEMTEKENLLLAKQFKIELGTCIAAPDTHFVLPGAAKVTNR
ncbi:MAG: hypothetical protein EB059_04850 [Alphaproteobacteria bacterium]|nr:hypothetical protein [Alphaproteobacteria bacterium]